MENKKIKSIEELKDIVSEFKKTGKKIVHCHGVFDLLHIGHIRYFEQSKRMGDILIVTITSDEYVDKGPHRPAFPQTLRIEAVASLNCVDYAAINKWATAEETLRLIRPDIYVKGSEFKNSSSDMTGKITREEAVINEIGAVLAFTEDIVFSSSNLINRYLSNFPKEINDYLELFRKRYNIEDIFKILDKMSSLKVLVIGDSIIDDYQYCNAIGKSSKDPSLVVKYISQDLFAGGVLAVANHVANFANHVDLVTLLGDKDSHENFIKSQLKTNVSPIFFVQTNSPTIVKRRFVDGYSFNKLFEVYIIDDSGVPVEIDHEIQKWLKHNIEKYDIVIAADFGHGAISKSTINMLIELSPFLAVNTQANAGNRGFHTISRYSKADYIAIAEHELRLEIRDNRSDIKSSIQIISEKLNCPKFVVTLGRKGCAVYNRNEEFIIIPSFAQKVIDRVGAGDAFLSVTALASKLGAKGEILGFIGNVVGALAVEIIGNKKAIDKLSVQKYIVSLMK